MGTGVMGSARFTAGPAAAAGVVSAGALLAVAQLAGVFLSARYSPLVALGSVFIDLTPAWLKDFAIAAFGTNDKTALGVGIGVATVALAAGAGVLAARHWVRGAVLVVALGALMSAAVLTRAGASPFDAVPSMLGTIAGLYALRLLVLRLPAPARPVDDGGASADASPGISPGISPASSPAPSRRGFVAWAGGTAAAAVVLALTAQLLGAGQRRAIRLRAALTLPAPAVPAAALPAGVQSPVAGVVPFITPNADFYRIDTALVVPQLDAAPWRLRIHGMVEREVTITFDELLAAGLEESYTTLSCVSNEVGGDLIGTARWLGYPIRTLLARAGPLPGADMVLSTSADGFTASTPLPVLQDGRNAVLAVGMNGEPLPVEHGYPVRMVVPGLYGFVSATKWVVDLEVTRFADAAAYWTSRGWSDHGPIKTESRIEVPRPDAQVPAGRVMIGGTAWSPQRGITKVQIRADDGGWQDAVLAAEASVDTWRQFSFAWDAAPGRHRLQVRAADAVDGIQTEVIANPAPDGASGWHTITVTVV